MRPFAKIWNRILFLCIFGISTIHSQEIIKTVQDIQVLISQDSLAKARSIVAENIAFYKSQKRFDSLADYIQFQGNFKLNNDDIPTAIAKARQLTDYIAATKDPNLIQQAFSEMAWVYNEAGQNDKAYNILLGAVEPTSRITETKSVAAADVQYSLGYYKGRIGDYPEAKKHYLKSLALLKKSKKEDYVFYHQIYTSLGGVVWQETKLDSAEYYFQQALNVLKKTDSSDLRNNLFRPSLIKLNMSIILNALGKNKEAIAMSYEAIDDLQKFIDKSVDPFYTKQAKTFIFSLLDNLASYHTTLGEFKRSEELMEYSYAQKQKEYEENDINIITSHILLAQAKTINRDFKGAAQHADRAIELFKDRPDGDTFWKAAAFSIRGTLYQEMGNMELARQFYERGDAAYRASSGDGFSREFLDHLITLSNFYVKNKEAQKAIATAKEAYDYVHKGSLKNTLQEFYQIENLASVYFKLKDYNQAIKYSDEALRFNLLTDGIKMASADSILAQYRKPGAILINTASRYYLSENKSAEQLKEYLSNIDQAISILDQRKKVVTTYEDVSILISENEELFNFAQKLRLELYGMTCDENYLNQVISLHESAIYNRIRSRLNLREMVAFKNIPKEVLATEFQLKSNMATTLENAQLGIGAYITASEKWETFVKTLQKDYPEYYKMRYETLEEPIEDLQAKIPENTTVVRYLFIEDKLYAFVVSPTQKDLIALDPANLEENLEQLAEEGFSVKKKSPLLFDLYIALWQPLERKIKTKKVVIIPDRELFNLSFEMLTPKPISDFKEFSTNSLLSLYDISYNFSLLLFKNHGNIIDYKENYVGFAPGFGKQMKDKYKIALQDSMKLDKAYLTLLSQPFSENLIKQYSKVFNGNYYTDQNASKPVFMNNAKEHKIIHIGTHAESNNISPELSRLVFAKKSGDKEEYDENSLYAYEIYNLDLSANLAILTACETGKPTYQAGEGAISLAHAFNYAGSESILTSLWDIDEVSSTQIVGYFYDYLSNGFPKDEALKKAKLKYLATAEDRGADPQYWAGLVLIGDTSTIQLQQAINPLWWWAIGLFVIGIFIFFLLKRKKG